MEKSLVKVETVSVCGTEVQAVRKGSEAYIVLRRMCENLEIDTDTQRKKLVNSEWATTVLITVLAEDGRQRNLFCLSLQSVPMWLSGIDVHHVKKSARPRLNGYQKEAAGVLYEWAFNRKAKKDENFINLRDPDDLRRGLLLLSEENKQLRTENKELVPRAKAHDDFISSKGYKCLQDAGKSLGQKPNNFIKQMVNKKYLFRRGRTLIPYQEYLNRGYFVVKNVITSNKRYQLQTFVTPKGIDFLYWSLVVKDQELSDSYAIARNSGENVYIPLLKSNNDVETSMERDYVYTDDDYFEESDDLDYLDEEEDIVYDPSNDPDVIVENDDDLEEEEVF
jgi:phage antirepressor YoqD-like protein